VLLTTATPTLLEDQVPPVVALPRVVAEPTHTLSTPVIGAIAVLTVMVLVVEQPPAIYVIEATPAESPVIPGVPIETTPNGLIVHTPPKGLAVNVVLVPTQTTELPTVVTGIGFTVSTLTAAHPDGITYDITVVPIDVPVTTPVLKLTEATAGLLLVHNPPVVALVNVPELPTHITEVPTIAAGTAFTVTTAYTELTPSV